MDVSLVLPVFNAGAVIESSVAALVTYLARSSLSHEILLRNDGSDDDSWARLTDLAGRYPQVRISQNDRNRGLGYTLRALFREARGKTVVYLDADLPFGPEVVGELLTGSSTADIVVASRYLGLENRVRPSRRLASWLYYRLCRVLFSVTVRDLGSGSVALSRKRIESLALRADGFDIHIELFTRASRLGLRIREIAVPSPARGLESFRLGRHGPAVVGQTFRFWRSWRNERSRD